MFGAYPAALGRAVGLSAGAAHDRVRKLREQGVIRRTTIDVDPPAVDRGVAAFFERPLATGAPYGQESR